MSQMSPSKFRLGTRPKGPKKAFRPLGGGPTLLLFGTQGPGRTPQGWGAASPEDRRKVLVPDPPRFRTRLWLPIQGTLADTKRQRRRSFSRTSSASACLAKKTTSSSICRWSLSPNKFPYKSNQKKHRKPGTGLDVNSASLIQRSVQRAHSALYSPRGPSALLIVSNQHNVAIDCPHLLNQVQSKGIRS